MTASCLIEMDRLTSEQACLLTLFILTQIREYLKVTPVRTREVRKVIFIEEAHNLLGKSSEATLTESFADPKGHATKLICKMLAELRALGVAIVIIDQLPSGVASEVIKNTGSKLTFRHVATDERADIGGAMLCTNMDMEDMARFEPGDAFFFTEGYHRPRRIKAVNLHERIDMSREPDDRELHETIVDEEWYKAATKNRVADELFALSETMERYLLKHRLLLGKVKKLGEHYISLKDRPLTDSTRDRLVKLANKLNNIEKDVISSREEFERNPFITYLKEDFTDPDPELAEFRDGMIKRYNDSVVKGSEALKKSARAMFKRCKTTLSREYHAK
jgi:hypothetical protein